MCPLTGPNFSIGLGLFSNFPHLSKQCKCKIYSTQEETASQELAITDTMSFIVIYSYCHISVFFPATRTFNNESFSVSLGDKTHFLPLFLSIQFPNCLLKHRHITGTVYNSSVKNLTRVYSYTSLFC